MSSGADQALEELQAIAVEDPSSIAIEKATPHGPEGNSLLIEFTLRIGRLEQSEDGLRFHDRESFVAYIPPSFPFDKPSIWVPHKRFAGFPHVQWSSYLCLYQARTEWNAADGMFGLIDRLWQWIENAAKNNLDPEEGALHPPATYVPNKDCAELVVSSNAPCEAGDNWVGWAQATLQGKVYSILGWHSLTDNYADVNLRDGLKFPSVILPKALPWEFPQNGNGLLEEILKQGGDRDWFLSLLTLASITREEGHPVVIVIGAPMRRGHDGILRLHFSAWELLDDTIDGLKNALPDSLDTEKISAIRKRIAELTLNIFEVAKINWCRIFEDRDEIVLRRDQNSASRAWFGKRVLVLGCGALGSISAELVARAGCSSITLVDNDVVTPGVLVRQNYTRSDIGRSKVEALKSRLQQIRPGLEVIAINLDGYFVAYDEKVMATVDIIIDSSANNLMHQRMERDWMKLPCRHVQYAAIEIDASATTCWGVVLNNETEIGPWSAFRESRFILCRSEVSKNFYSKFDRDSKRRPFQPEPGCSEPTFEGSASDLVLAASGALNRIALWLLGGANHNQMFALEQTQGVVTEEDIPKQIRRSLGDLDVVVSRQVLEEVFANIRKHSRENDELSETGGLLWGQWDSAANVAWITDGSSAPKDSICSSERFVCGSEGTKEEHDSRTEVSGGICGFVGMWHTHPGSPPCQSIVDISGMLDMLVLRSEGRRRLILLIVGKEGERTRLGIYAYQRTTEKGYESLTVTPRFINLGRKRWK